MQGGGLSTSRREQCSKCPWKVGVDPYEIPHGYDREKHAKLNRTIASGTQTLRGFRAMSCHEFTVDDERPCVGWLHNQLGSGNNLGLRLAVITGKIDGRYELDGEQHETLASSFPGRRRDVAIRTWSRQRRRRLRSR